MNELPTCGLCGKIMTPENSRIRPELFLCDACTDPSHQAVSELIKLTQAVTPIEEEERQLIILSLALCSLLRPGWGHLCRETAAKLHGGNPEMFDNFRKYNENVEPQK